MTHQCLRSILLCLYLLVATTGFAQNQPCSINAGAPFNICFYDQHFQLQGLLGDNVDPGSVDWDVSDPGGFHIQNENDPASIVNPVLSGGFPVGTVVFTLNAKCNDGTPLSTTVEITVNSLGTTAQILANGNDVEEIRVCNTVTLSAGQILKPGETGAWIAGNLDNFITVSGQLNDPDITLTSVPNNITDCNTYTFYYQISNGGCVSTDSVQIRFEGAAPTPKLLYPEPDQTLCTSGMFLLSGTAVGCKGKGQFSVLSVPAGASPPTITGYSANDFNVEATATVDQSGEYVFVYTVDITNGLCPGGADTVRMFVCLTPAGFQDIRRRFCDIPAQVTLSSPNYPGVNYGPWLWSSVPSITVDTPVITPTGGGNASVSISNFSVTQYTFRRSISVDNCSFQLESVVDTLYCPNEYVQVNENLETILHLVCDQSNNYFVLSLNPDYIQDLTLEPICANGVCKYVVRYTQNILVQCNISHAVTYYSRPHYPDSSILFLCGGPASFKIKPYYPNTGDNIVRIQVMAAPPGHSSLQVGRQFFDFPTVNLQMPGQYIFRVALSSVGECRDTSFLTIQVEDIPPPAAPVVTDFCVNDTVQLVGSEPASTAAQVLWTQLSGPTLNFLDHVTQTDPRIQATQAGHYVLEYSFSRTPDCYLADTVAFDVMLCNSSCLLAELLSVRCFDNGSADPNDDYWNFDIIVHQGPGTYWEAPTLPEAGAYEQVKTIWPGSIAASGSTYTLVVQDHEQPDCTASLTVPVPKPCSEPCNLILKTDLSPCNDNGTPLLVSDDYYSVSLTVAGIQNECWMVKQTNADGTSQILGTFTSSGDTTITLGPFLVQDGNWSLWVVLCNQMTCSADAFIVAPSPCSGCHDVVISNITCYDNGTSDPSDDHWSFDILVGGNSNSYWTATAPVSQSGPYWQVKTVYMGQINQYGSEIEFSIFDNKNEACRTDVKVAVPRVCSDTCKLTFETTVLECRWVERQLLYFVRLSVGNTDDGCWMAKQKRSDGSEVVLGTWTGDRTVELGPFDPALGDWTLWVMPCEQFDCVRDQFIDAPVCDDKGEQGRPATQRVLPNTYVLFPSPASSELRIRRSAPADAETGGEAAFRVLDLLGNTVLEQSMSVAWEYRLPLGELPPGMYFLFVGEPGEAGWSGKFFKR